LATYEELKGLVKNSALQDKVEVACWKWADTVLNEADSVTDHAKRVTQARSILANPAAVMRQVLPAVLAANSSSTTSQITGAADATVQTAVDTVLDELAVDLKAAGSTVPGQ
jgi:hypothetical protein